MASRTCEVGLEFLRLAFENPGRVFRIICRAVFAICVLRASRPLVLERGTPTQSSTLGRKVVVTWQRLPCCSPKRRAIHSHEITSSQKPRVRPYSAVQIREKEKSASLEEPQE